MGASRRVVVGLWCSVLAAAVVAACGGGDGGSSNNPGFGGSGGDGGSSAAGGAAGDAGSGAFGGTAGSLNIDGGGGNVHAFNVTPEAPQRITVPFGTQAPTVSFEATLNGSPAPAGWAVDRGEVGTITLGNTATATFTPSGVVGGLVTITAGLNDETVSREVFVELTGEQNGADPTRPGQAGQIPGSVSELTEGGGVAGVGGEGLGVAVTDPGVRGALDNPSGSGAAEGLRLLYPYDRTVFPRGILAPLLAWDWSLGDADAIQIELSTQSGSFQWKGTFGRPAILDQTGGAFIRHPIPQDVWEAATNTADGASDQLALRLTIARGGQAYGPLTASFTVAPTRLSGVIYYNSYGTNLAKNFGGAVGGDGRFGGAVLSIRVGDSGPQLVAGGHGNTTQCRVCHSVAADGSRLVVQHGNDNSASSAYDLAPGGSTETPMGIGAEFPGVSPDGSMAIAPSGQLLPLPAATAPLAATGLTDVSTNVGTPAFAPNGQRIVFNPMVSGSISNPTQKLIVMDFDPSTLSFSNLQEVADYSGSPEQVRPGWAAFLPDSEALVFHLQSQAGGDGNGHGAMFTRRGSKAQLFWSRLGGASNVTPMNWLNGLDASGNSYLPRLSAPVSMSCTGDGQQVGDVDADHGDDANLNYEPTVSPIPGAGYAWVVFTSRRMYGNVATIPPFCSDPRGVDLVTHITPKKLWVAAVNLNATPGTDPSYPAFYLPGQELLAGNSRGFWVFDPCRPDGESCATGDQCCNGYCQPNSSGELVCSNEPPGGQCSQVQERCTTAADCCDPTNRCVNGFCAQDGPK
ncbi:MAG: hypothetical protein KIT72_08255 [Polyangiaceae bacterium]|nr:hypothetical protein [Polyangiaceae bacterium]MCW5790399.1 hypothetical protein [Polyangiaceae bacterium]